jgi:hypothetical protein
MAVKSPGRVGDVTHGDFQGAVGRVVQNADTAYLRPEDLHQPFNLRTLDYDSLMVTFDFLQKLYERNHGVDPLFICFADAAALAISSQIFRAGRQAKEARAAYEEV